MKMGKLNGKERCSRKDQHGEGNDNPLQYSCLENPMDKGWWATVHGIVELDTTERLHFHFQPSTEKTFSSCFLEFSKTCDHIFL